MSVPTPSSDVPLRRSVLLQISAVLIGVAFAATLFALAGFLTRNAVPGAIAGIPIGAIIGWGMIKGWVRPYVGWMLAFAVLAAWLGGGGDAVLVTSALVGAIFGAFMTWRRVSVLAAGVIGAFVTSSMLGFVMGCILGWVVAYIAPDRLKQLFAKREIIDRPSYASLREHKA